MSDPQENLGSLNDVYVKQANGKKALAVTGGGVPLATLPESKTTDTVIIPFNKVTNNTTLSVLAVLDENTITVASATGISAGSFLIIFDPVSLRASTFYVTNVVSLVITLDSPIDFAFPVDSNVDVAITDMSVNGSVTPQVFGIRGTGIIPGVDLTINITRLIFSCTATSAVDLTKFANIAKLTNGLMLRSRNGKKFNVFNVKDNSEITGILYDFDVYSASNPQQGVDGFAARLTFSKMGTVIQLPLGEDLEFWVQDDLSGITSLKIMAEGNFCDVC